jgi:hypothetical protein
MSVTRHLLRSVSARFSAWLSKIGEENRPQPHQYDHLPEETTLLSNRDRIGDEKG